MKKNIMAMLWVIGLVRLGCIFWSGGQIQGYAGNISAFILAPLAVVAQGQIIAKVGNSGTTSELHLHLQHRRNNPLATPFPLCAEGLPIRFSEEYAFVF